MEEVDLRIMRHMGLAPFLVWPHPPASLRPPAIARALKVSSDTVKRRLAAMRKAAVFHGTHVFPNPRLLGLRMASLHFQPVGQRVPAQEIAAVPGVLGVFDMVGGDRCIDVAFGDGRPRPALEKDLVAVLGATPHHFVDYAAPVPQQELSRLDWRIVQALRSRPDTTLEQAADHIGLSLRTVKRRFDRMAKAGAIDVIGLFDPGAVKGHVVVDLLLHLQPGSGPADLAQVLNLFRTRWVAQWSPPDQRLGHIALVFVAASAREIEDLRREAESLACVRRCDALVVEGAREDWAWIDAQVARLAGDAPLAPQAKRSEGRSSKPVVVTPKARSR